MRIVSRELSTWVPASDYLPLKERGRLTGRPPFARTTPQADMCYIRSTQPGRQPDRCLDVFDSKAYPGAVSVDLPARAPFA